MRILNLQVNPVESSLLLNPTFFKFSCDLNKVFLSNHELIDLLIFLKPNLVKNSKFFIFKIQTKL